MKEDQQTSFKEPSFGEFLLEPLKSAAESTQVVLEFMQKDPATFLTMVRQDAEQLIQKLSKSKS